MSHAAIIKEESVLETIQSTEMVDLLNELMSRLFKVNGIKKTVAGRIREHLNKKLDQGATGAIGHGVAVPHVKVPGVRSTMAVFGRSSEGVDFRAGDGVPVNLVFLVVGPEDAPEEHLAFMRWVAGIARNRDFRRFAMGCSSPADLVELLQEMEGG